MRRRALVMTGISSTSIRLAGGAYGAVVSAAVTAAWVDWQLTGRAREVHSIM